MNMAISGDGCLNPAALQSTGDLIESGSQTNSINHMTASLYRAVYKNKIFNASLSGTDTLEVGHKKSFCRTYGTQVEQDNGKLSKVFFAVRRTDSFLPRR